MTASFRVPSPRPSATLSSAVSSVSSLPVRPILNWTEFGRILVVRPGNLGDALMLTPALHALREGAPSSRIDLLTSPAGTTVRELVPALDSVVIGTPSWYDTASAEDPTADIRRCARQEQALIGTLAVRDYDAMIVFTSSNQTPWAAAHAGLLAGIGVRAVHSAKSAGLVASHCIRPPEGPTHQVDRALHLLHRLGVPAKGSGLRIEIPKHAVIAADEELVEMTGPFAVLTPGCTRPEFRYPAARFATVARALAASGLPVLVGGSARESALITKVVSLAAQPGVRELGPVSIAVLAEVIARADVLVGNDSGPMHLADAVGTPVAIAYGGKERADDTRPRSVRAELLRGSESCLDIAPAELVRAAHTVVSDSALLTQ